MEIFQDYGEIKYESFATEIHERRSKHKILQDYRVFRLMETFPFIDPQRSELSHDGTIIKRAVLYDGAEDRAPALFRDEHFKHLVFMSRSLRNAIDNHGFTGCQFQTLDEYSAKLRLLHRF